MQVGSMFEVHTAGMLVVAGREAGQTRIECAVALVLAVGQASIWKLAARMEVRASSERWPVLPVEALGSISMTVGEPRVALAGCLFLRALMAA